uniref:Uncharacterized protein n=1 Tax=Peronospora matthiolae TaxID=2874970 RepID=A0AAV1V167_9STRA
MTDQVIDQATPFLRAHPAHPEETEKKSGWCDRFGKSAAWFATNKNFEAIVAVASIWTTTKVTSTLSTVSRLKKMGNKRPAIKK